MRHNTKYGEVSRSTVKWAYNFDPLKKWIAIIMSAIMFAGTVSYLQREVVKNKQKVEIQKEADIAKRTYLEKRLEIIKQETIAAEERRIELENQKKQEAKPSQEIKEKRPLIYTWTDDHGNIVHSNQKRTSN